MRGASFSGVFLIVFFVRMWLLALLLVSVQREESIHAPSLLHDLRGASNFAS